MIIKDIKVKEILENKDINSKFLSVKNQVLNIDCKTLNTNFYIDSFNFFPISEEGYTFQNVFSWGDNSKYNIHKTKHFIKNFNDRKNTFKEFSNLIVLGSSANNDYYRNIVTFLPRIFFLTQKELSLAIHRNSSNEFRAFIKKILNQLDIKLKKFVYLDDDYYKFIDSQIPQFFSIADSIKILKTNFPNIKKEKKLKIFLSRQNAKYRNLINQDDISKMLKKNGFEVIDPNTMTIFEQIEIFSKAEIIIGPTCSALSNAIFSAEGAKLIEIKPKYQFKYETGFRDRYLELCSLLNINYSFVEADPIESEKYDKNILKYISKKAYEESNYYKDLLLEKNKIKNII